MSIQRDSVQVENPSQAEKLRAQVELYQETQKIIQEGGKVGMCYQCAKLGWYGSTSRWHRLCDTCQRAGGKLKVLATRLLSLEFTGISSLEYLPEGAKPLFEAFIQGIYFRPPERAEAMGPSHSTVVVYRGLVQLPPAHIAFYLGDLVQTYHQYFAEIHVAATISGERQDNTTVLSFSTRDFLTLQSA